LMVVDDDVLLIGSANINERSMNGTRDTEIGILAFQPGHSRRGVVHGFRMALWCEHLGHYSDCYLDPESPSAFNYLTKCTEENWAMYTQDNPCDMNAHLLPYPVEVGDDGLVTMKVRWFPDTYASIRGKDRALVPNVLTS